MTGGLAGSFYSCDPINVSHCFKIFRIVLFFYKSIVLWGFMVHSNHHHDGDNCCYCDTIGNGDTNDDGDNGSKGDDDGDDIGDDAADDDDDDIGAGTKNEI